MLILSLHWETDEGEEEVKSVQEETPPLQDLSVYVWSSESMMQKIDAFQAAVFQSRSCLKCF